MPRPTNAPRFTATPVKQAEQAAEQRGSMSDTARAARARAQIASGQYLDDDGLDAFLDSLQIPTTKV